MSTTPAVSTLASAVQAAMTLDPASAVANKMVTSAVANKMVSPVVMAAETS